MEAFHGWATDPFGAHEARYFSEGKPTSRVRDGDTESYDDLPGDAHVPGGDAGSQPAPPPPGPFAPSSPAGVPVSPAVPVAPAVPTPIPPPPAWAGPPSGPAPGASGELPATGPDGFSDTFAVSAPSAPEGSDKRAKRPLVAVVAALVVAAVVGSSVVLIGGGKSAEAEVIAAVNSAMADRTAHLSVNLAGDTAGQTISGAGSGAIDFNQNALDMNLTVSAEGQQVPVQEKYLGGVLYESIPGLDQLAPGKSWISIDTSSLQQAAGQSPSAAGVGNNPAAMLRLLAQQGNTVVPLGPSTAGGVAVQGYSVTINASAIKSKLDQGRLPSWMQQALANVNFQDMRLKVFVDDAGLLRRMAIHMALTSTSNGSFTIDVALDFSDYGTPVNVTAPPSDQVVSFQDFLQAAQQAGGSTP